MKKKLRKMLEELDTVFANKFLNTTYNWITDKKWFKTITLIVVLCGAILGVSLLILMIQNPWGLVQKGDDWISFWGSISGSIIGAVVTLVALKKTIEYEKVKSEAETDLNNRPYLVCQMIETQLWPEYEFRTYIKCDNHIEENAPNAVDGKTLDFSIKNIGADTCLDVKLLKVKWDGIKTENIYRVNAGSKTKLLIPYIEKGECLNYKLRMDNYKTFGSNDEIELIYTFSDILGCYYYQTIIFKLCGNDCDVLDIRAPQKLGKQYTIVHTRMKNL